MLQLACRPNSLAFGGVSIFGMLCCWACAIGRLINGGLNVGDVSLRTCFFFSFFFFKSNETREVGPVVGRWCHLRDSGPGKPGEAAEDNGAAGKVVLTRPPQNNRQK